MASSGQHEAGPSIPAGPRSRALLTLMLRVPRPLLMVVIILVLLGGAFLPGVPGAALLVLLAALVGWLAFLTWGFASVVGRLGRIVAIAVLLLLAVAKF